MPAGYSGTPLKQKLGIKSGMRVAILGAPKHYAKLLGALPEGVSLLSRAGREMDFIHLFVTKERDLERRLTSLVPRLAPAGMLWISWPKGSSPLATELGGAAVRALGLASGLVDVKVCAVDEDWSGLKFVRRVSDR